MSVCTPPHAQTPIDAITQHNSLGSIIISSSSDRQREFSVMENIVWMAYSGGTRNSFKQASKSTHAGAFKWQYFQPQQSINESGSSPLSESLVCWSFRFGTYTFGYFFQIPEIGAHTVGMSSCVLE